MNKNHKIIKVLWQDAAYSFDRKVPKGKPLPKLTFGILVEDNERFIQVAMNSSYNKETGDLEPVDSFFIPKGVIMEIKKLDEYEE